MEKSAENSPIVKPIDRDYKTDTDSGIIINRNDQTESAVPKNNNDNIKLLPESDNVKPDVLKNEQGIIER